MTRVEYVGFTNEGLWRQYRLRVQDGANPSRDFVVGIAHEAFVAHRARFQDAPDICFQKLQKALSAAAETPICDHMNVSDIELDEYRRAHSGKPGGRRASAERLEVALTPDVEKVAGAKGSQG